MLDKITQDIIELYIEMETQLLNNVAKKIAKDKALYTTVNEVTVTDWQLERLKELDSLTKENIKYIAKQSKKTVKEIETLIEKTLDNVPDETKEAIAKGFLNAIPPIRDSQLVKNALIVARNEVRTTLNQVNKSMLQSAGNTYVKSVNQITTNVLAGIETTQQAALKVARQMANDGLTGFVASNGAEWSPEAYTTMVVKSNVKNTINTIQDIRIQEAGGNYIEINSYSGARPLCSQDQGRIFSLNGDTTPIKTIDGITIYPRPWSESTYGQPAGILGINCGHQKFLFTPELSGYDRPTIDKKENDEAYQLSQKQRYLERQVRYAKRENEISKNMGLETDNTKIREKQKVLREFVAENDLTRRPINEQI